MVDHRRRRLIAAPILAGFAFLSTSQAQAQPAREGHDVTLRAIMQELGAEHLRLTNALLMEDFKDLDASAKAIHDHPLPNEIVAAIKSKLGRGFSAFERIDRQSHQAAAELGKRAAAKDISGAARAFGQLAESCVSCHKQFRSALRPLSDK